MQRRLLFRTFQVLLGVLFGLALVFVWVRARATDVAIEVPSTRYFLPSPIPVSDFALPSSAGRPVSSRDFPGKILVVFFGYTSCPDVCPLTLTRLNRAFGQLEEDGSRIQVLLITVDPARDTGERLEEYLRNFHPSFLGLTGETEEIRSVADLFGVYFSEPSGESNYTVDHTARAFVIDRFGRIALTFPVTATAQEMAQELQTLIEISGG